MSTERTLEAPNPPSTTAPRSTETRSYLVYELRTSTLPGPRTPLLGVVGGPDIATALTAARHHVRERSSALFVLDLAHALAMTPGDRAAMVANLALALDSVDPRQERAL